MDRPGDRFLALRAGLRHVGFMSSRRANGSSGATPTPHTFELSPELEKELRDAVAEIERGEGLEVTLAQLEAWGETGEFPWPDESRG
jgi:hypothetical protein